MNHLLILYSGFALSLAITMAFLAADMTCFQFVFLVCLLHALYFIGKVEVSEAVILG